MAKTAKVAKDETTPVDPATPEGEAVPAPKRSKKKLLIGGGLGLVLCLGGGGYFAVPAALAMLSPAGDAAPVAQAPKATHGESAVAAASSPLAVVQVVSSASSASDYQIVSIYDGEAYLATADNLIRIKVGSTTPGIGDIISITSTESGGIVVGSLATLKTT
jgi:hypothetical protein